MDGTLSTGPRRLNARRRLTALLAVALGTMAFAAPAEAAPAVASDTAMATAEQFAAEHWGGQACGGDVTITWTTMSAQTNATASWLNPIAAYGHADKNMQCHIDFNDAQTWDWPKLCTVIVHEYGHLMGQDHSADADDVMSAVYTSPLDVCDTPGPGLPAETAVATAADEDVVADETDDAAVTAPPAPTGATTATAATSARTAQVKAAAAKAKKAKAKAAAKAKKAKAKAKAKAARAKSAKSAKSSKAKLRAPRPRSRSSISPAPITARIALGASARARVALGATPRRTGGKVVARSALLPTPRTFKAA